MTVSKIDLAFSPKQSSYVYLIFKSLLNFGKLQPLGLIGGILVFFLLIMAIFANLISPYDYDKQIYADALQGPSPRHLFGTDDLGRDLFSRITYGAQISMIIGLGTIIVSTTIAVIVGGVSGFLGGLFDIIMQRIVEAIQAFPALVLLISIIAIVGQGRWQLIIVLGFLFSVGASRVIRSGVISIKSNMYFESARSIGATDFRLFWRYVLPNITPIIIVLATVQIGAAILAESSLSFLGYGVPPPFPTWGRLLSGVARSYIIENPWMGLWPGLFIALAVFGFNMLGDALRDVLDPRLRGSR